VRLTVLGCSGSAPGPNAVTSGYLVEAEDFRLVLDLGGGTLAKLQTHTDPFDLGAVLLSHLHLDHCADISGLAEYRRGHPEPPFDPREHRLPVYAPEEAPRRLAAAHAPSAEHRADTDLGDVFDFRLLAHGTVRIGPFEVTAAPVSHPCPAFGFRIGYGGRTLVYSGDTAPCAALVELARDADALLADSAWLSGANPPNLHMSGKEAGQTARQAGVRRLLLTHVQPWIDRSTVLAEAAAAFGGHTELVEQGASYSP
jgi:ribonuclease BN (tRNA processing enzyme)